MDEREFRRRSAYRLACETMVFAAALPVVTPAAEAACGYEHSQFVKDAQPAATLPTSNWDLPEEPPVDSRRVGPTVFAVGTASWPHTPEWIRY
jgi:hypothetical protein